MLQLFPMSNLHAPHPNCGVIVVTHNAEKFIGKCISALQAQTVKPAAIVIVDSGSANAEYLTSYQSDPTVQVVLCQGDIGFCRGNNIGLQHLPTNCDTVLFLNPDAFLTETFIEEGLKLLQSPHNSQVGALTGILLGYNIAADKPSALVDSAGIFCSWYGHWYDRDQGAPYRPERYLQSEMVPAICGALIFCRREAIESVMLKPHQLFDESFYMYKEDIDLSLRLRAKGWQLLFDPKLIAYHCRGWNRNRQAMPRTYRLMSAHNELRLHLRHRPVGVPYSLLKLIGVYAFDI